MVEPRHIAMLYRCRRGGQFPPDVFGSSARSMRRRPGEQFAGCSGDIQILANPFLSTRTATMPSTSM